MSQHRGTGNSLYILAEQGFIDYEDELTRSRKLSLFPSNQGISMMTKNPLHPQSPVGPIRMGKRSLRVRCSGGDNLAWEEPSMHGEDNNENQEHQC